MAARKPGPIEDAARSGDQRATLEAMRDRLAAQMDRATPAIAAQLAGQLAKTLKDLAALPAVKEGSKLDEVKQRREARRLAAASASPAAGGSGRQRR